MFCRANDNFGHLKDRFKYFFILYSVVDLRGARGTRAPPGPKFLHFHAVFGKNWPNNRLAPPPLGLAPPPLGNPGSATGISTHISNAVNYEGDS